MNIERLTISKLETIIVDAGLIGKITYEEDQLRPILISFLKSLEEIACDACRPFNSFGLLCALAHYTPTNIASPQVGFEGDAQISFNNAATLAFRFSSSTNDAKVKFTPVDYKKIVEANDLSWVEDYSEILLQIYYLVHIIDIFLKILRQLGKGASATIDLTANDISTIIQMQIPAELQQKMREYDERLIHNQSIFIKSAIPLGAIKPESPLNCVVVNPNWAEYRKGNLNPPPIPRIFGMDAIYTITSFLADDILQIFNRRIHVEDLFVFLSALFKPLVENALNDVRFAGQGYSFVEEQHLIDYIVDWAPKIYVDCFNQGAFPDDTPFVLESLSQSYWREVAPQLLRFISHDFIDRDSIDHLLLRPNKFAYRCDNGTIFLHLGSVSHFFMYLLDEFQKSGKFGEIKGKTFELLLLQLIESIKGFHRIWNPRYELKLPVGKRTSTDIDAFVRWNEIAFLISCKSYGINREYELGNGQTCWDRSGDAKSWLNFTHQTAKVIARHHEELKLPKGLRGIMPLVCTGWPEYLYDPSQDYFMEDGTPRIATMREIEQFCNSFDNIKAAALLSDPWMVSIPDN